MKQLFASVSAVFRHYSSSATYSRGKTWWNNSYKNKYKGKKKGRAITPKEPKIEWTGEQAETLRAISDGKSVFISGSAGTGKTFLVKHIIRRLRKIHGGSHVFVTASTGLAACALDGSTLHSFAGTGFGDDDPERMILRVLSDRRAYGRWNKVKALIIDEISMIDATYFDNLEKVARAVRDQEPECKYKVWGGMQLVVSGDYMQLPPVNSKKDKKKREFAFEANCWTESFHLQIELTNVFRQEDAHLVRALQEIRKGECGPDALKLLEKCCSTKDKDPSAVQLFPRNEDVERVNKQELLRLGQEIVAYRALDSGEDHWKKQLELGIAPDRLELCIGARVMLCKNINPWKKLVNGATGEIVGFNDKHGRAVIRDDSDTDEENDADIYSICNRGDLLPVVKFDCGQELEIGLEKWLVMDGERIVAIRKQIPLRLAWALSIHKCQGMTLDRLYTNLDRAFCDGMVYVALSRVKTIEGLHLSGFNPSKIKAHPKVLEYYQKTFKSAR